MAPKKAAAFFSNVNKMATERIKGLPRIHLALWQ